VWSFWYSLEEEERHCAPAAPLDCGQRPGEALSVVVVVVVTFLAFLTRVLFAGLGLQMPNLRVFGVCVRACANLLLYVLLLLLLLVLLWW
jgi:hypothetical protein